MRKIKMVVGNVPVGKALTWAYPHGNPSSKTFLIPTYKLTISGTNSKGTAESKTFEVFRFGVWKKSPTSAPTVVGLADAQTHIIKSWIPTYEVHSANSRENGAWQVYGNFLIHDGPDKPMSRRSVFASIGCLSVCGGPEGFVTFNDFIIELSGSTASNRNDQLIEIGKARNISITYKAAKRPALTVY